MQLQISQIPIIQAKRSAGSISQRIEPAQKMGILTIR
jgi:hypothetical protein